MLIISTSVKNINKKQVIINTFKSFKSHTTAKVEH